MQNKAVPKGMCTGCGNIISVLLEYRGQLGKTLSDLALPALKQFVKVILAEFGRRKSSLRGREVPSPVAKDLPLLADAKRLPTTVLNAYKSTDSESMFRVQL